MIRVSRPKMDLSGLEGLRKSLESRPSGIEFRIPPEQQRKLEAFREARDILEMTPTALASFLRAMQQGADSAREGGNPIREGLEAGAQDLKRLYTDRFLKSGGDVALKALSRAWAARKRRRGLDPRIGYATGALARAIAQSTIVVR